MKDKCFLLVVFCLLSFSIFCQKDLKQPTSIYTFNITTKDVIDFSSIQKKLNFEDFKFVYASLIDMETNTFSIETKYLGKKTSKLIYDDYKRYQDRNLLKGFLVKNDPTRWNLHCPQNNVYKFEKKQN